MEKERKNKAYKQIKRKTKISPEQAKRIIYKLKKAEINLVDKNYDDDSVVYLDGDYLTINLLRNDKIEKFSFDEIYPISYKKREKTPLRSKIQEWLTIINEELNLKKQLTKIKNKLNKGTYCYSRGINTICFNKE